MRNGYQNNIPHVSSPPGQDWMPDYPNPPDFQFNYFKLMDMARKAGTPIAKARPRTTGKKTTVGIVGAGVAGLTAARELWRAGYKVVIFEASDRISGRLYTESPPGSTTSFEMGAMRMPFFNNGPEASKSTNCLLSYFLNWDQQRTDGLIPTRAEMSNFPNPGTAPGNTGIYMDGGYGPNGAYKTPTLTMWPAGGDPTNADLLKISKMVNDFVTFFTDVVGAQYVTDQWPELWKKIATHYDKMSFSDLVFTPAITTYNNDGWFGGLGMNEAESKLFYTIGSGDGSWGAFYGVGAMWFLRCVMFGYNSNLQSVSGLSKASALPYYDQEVYDSMGIKMTGPLYRGIQSLSELLFYLPPPDRSDSLYSACVNDADSSALLFVKTPIKEIQKLFNGGFSLVMDEKGNPPFAVDHVIVAAPIWAAQLSIRFTGFSTEQLPWSVPTALAEQHLIASCKVFFRLNKVYWKQSGSTIPQVLVTDTFLQDAYGVNWGNDAVLLASYTWEDDAVKLLATDPTTLAARVLDKLEEITQQTLGQSIREHVVEGSGVVFQWTQQPSYRGCAKLYRQRNWQQCYDLMAYNQQHSKESGLYFAGESYGTEGGWTEPALRTALDAVIRLVNNTDGSFANNFNVNDNYPRFDVVFAPKETYPQTAA